MKAGSINGGLVLVATLSGAPAAAQAPLHTITTSTPYDLFGNECCGIGDADADGFADVAVSAYARSRLEVFSGASGKQLFALSGNYANDKNSFGFAMDAAGDVDGDGRPDFVVGACKNSNNGPGSGRVGVYSASDGTLLREVFGPHADAWMGFSVGGTGDVDADGYDDWVAGAPFDDSVGLSSGRAYVYSGKDASLLFTFSGTAAKQRLGYSVDGAGDVDADGHCDVIVGADWETYGGKTFAGTARVFSGLDGSVLHTWGGSWNSSYGWSVSTAGDVDGDGHDDVIIGAYQYEAFGKQAAGRVEVRSGKSGALLHAFQGTTANEHVGRRVNEAGDVDGDGHADFMYSAVWTGVNYVRVISGADGSEITRFDGIVSLGLGIAAAGDVNADGLGDLIVGAPQVTPTQGEAYVHLGSLGILGDTYCSPAVPNSTGVPADLFASGSAKVADDSLRLTAQHLPKDRFGLFLVGSAPGFLTNPGGSQGNLCLGGALGRFASQPLHSGASGTASLMVDLTTLSGLGPVLPGQTWCFQVWYQDDNPGPTSNLSGAVSIDFY